MFKRVFIQTLPVMAGYIVLGIGFGILLHVNGYGILYSFLMSLLIYAGSLQYVGVSLIAGGATVITALLTSLMVNARHLFYGISMIDRYKGAKWKKPYLIFSLTDETYSLLCNDNSPKEPETFRYYTLISVLNHSYWILGSVLGSLIGSVIKFNTAGIEFSMTALFVTVFVEQWLQTKQHLPALLGIMITVLCLLIFGKESFLIPSMLLITLALFILRPYLEKKEVPHD